MKKPAWRRFHRQKRIAKKLFLKWEAIVTDEIVKVFGEPVYRRGEYCSWCNSAIIGWMWWERASYEYDEWECLCSACAHDKIHQFDDASYCSNSMCRRGMIYNPIRKSTGRRKYENCPECGAEFFKDAP